MPLCARRPITRPSMPLQLRVDENGLFSCGFPSSASPASSSRIAVAAFCRQFVHSSLTNRPKWAVFSRKVTFIPQLGMAREASGAVSEFNFPGWSPARVQDMRFSSLHRPMKCVTRMFKSIYSLVVVFFMLLHTQVSRHVVTAAEIEPKERRSQKSSLHLPSLPQLGAFKLWVREKNDVLVRRELAQQGGRNRCSEEPETAWNTEVFVNTRGKTIFTQSWIPAAGKRMKGLVVILHGLNEYSGRYAYFARQLNVADFGVFGMDWIGHGGSDGLHGYVESLDYAVSDTIEFMQKVAMQHPSVPCFLFGHSTGGSIAVKVAIQPSAKAFLKGLVLTSPALRIQPGHPVLRALAPLFSILLPKYQFRGNRKRLPVCRDPAALAAKYSDPLVYTGPIRVRTATEILRITNYLQRNLSKVSIPFFVLHGTEDKVTDPSASQDLYDQAASVYKNAKFYDGLLHDLLFELEKDSIAADIIDWLDRMIKVA